MRKKRRSKPASPDSPLLPQVNAVASVKLPMTEMVKPGVIHSPLRRETDGGPEQKHHNLRPHSVLGGKEEGRDQTRTEVGHGQCQHATDRSTHPTRTKSSPAAARSTAGTQVAAKLDKEPKYVRTRGPKSGPKQAIFMKGSTMSTESLPPEIKHQELYRMINEKGSRSPAPA